MNTNFKVGQTVELKLGNEVLQKSEIVKINRLHIILANGTKTDLHGVCRVRLAGLVSSRVELAHLV